MEDLKHQIMSFCFMIDYGQCINVFVLVVTDKLKSVSQWMSYVLKIFVKFSDEELRS